jgi:hypothetical protein
MRVVKGLCYAHAALRHGGPLAVVARARRTPQSPTLRYTTIFIGLNPVFTDLRLVDLR